MEHLDDEENITIIKDSLNNEELKVADKVADEILQKEEQEQKRLLIFVLIFVLLTLFVSFAGFSLFKIKQGSNNNIINAGAVAFSYSERTNAISMINTYPMTDEVGKKLSGIGEYFEFTISTRIESAKISNITYEITLTPIENENTLDEKYVRVYLEEDGNAVLVNKNEVNSFNKLPNSNLTTRGKNSKMLYKKTVRGKTLTTYKFRMWVDEDYNVDNVSRTFKCYLYVDAY